MGGLSKVLKIYGSMTVKNGNGKSVKWVYDYAQDKPRIFSEMTKEEIRLSEKAKWAKK